MINPRFLLWPCTILTTLSYFCSLLVWLFNVQYDGAGIYLYLVMFVTGIIRSLSDFSVELFVPVLKDDTYKDVITLLISYIVSVSLDSVIRFLTENLRNRKKN